ncbi:MAG: hypothetical protein AAB958_02785 [Patescibacteria group bacterium]
MRYELKLAKLIEKGFDLNVLSYDLPVEVVAVLGHLGSLKEASLALEEGALVYPFIGDRAALILRIPLKLMETVIELNRAGASPLCLVQMLGEGHLGKWRSNGSLKKAFFDARGTFPVSRAAKSN